LPFQDKPKTFKTSEFIEVYDVNFDDINLSKEIVAKIEEKLKRQQEAEAMKYVKRKAEEEAEIVQLQVRKEAESEFIKRENENRIKKMKALREAEDEVIKAEARAKAQKLINTNLSPNYLKLRALRKSLQSF
jgi:regulator of protease activity HflC (stomatin/prohibitin superfamily)